LDTRIRQSALSLAKNRGMFKRIAT